MPSRRSKSIKSGPRSQSEAAQKRAKAADEIEREAPSTSSSMVCKIRYNTLLTKFLERVYPTFHLIHFLII